MKIDFTSGDIAHQPADALIAFVDAKGNWHAGMDISVARAVYAVTKDMKLRDHVQADGLPVHRPVPETFRCAFGSVIFAAERPDTTLRRAFGAALQMAERLECKTVSLPVLRSRDGLGADEPDFDMAIDMVAAGVRRFAQSQPRAVKQLTIVGNREYLALQRLRYIINS